MRDALIGAVLIALAIFAAIYGGMKYERSEHAAEVAAAKAELEQRLAEASNAYNRQKEIDDAELAKLRKAAETAPANSSIAVKKDMAKRIGSIK